MHHRPLARPPAGELAEQRRGQTVSANSGVSFRVSSHRHPQLVGNRAESCLVQSMYMYYVPCVYCLYSTEHLRGFPNRRGPGTLQGSTVPRSCGPLIGRGPARCQMQQLALRAVDRNSASAPPQVPVSDVHGSLWSAVTCPATQAAVGPGELPFHTLKRPGSCPMIHRAFPPPPKKGRRPHWTWTPQIPPLQKVVPTKVVQCRRCQRPSGRDL